MEIDGLRQLLAELQRTIEHAPIKVPDKLRALRALSGLAGCAAHGVAESPDAFAHVATLLELSMEVPAVKGLLQHYPVLSEHGDDERVTGWGAL